MGVDADILHNCCILTVSLHKDIRKMSASDYAAWYAAFVVTAVLIWDVVKWKKAGPQIKGEARSGWRSYGIAETEGKDLTIVKATNTGDRPTTLTSWGMYWYPKEASLKDKKARKSFIIKGGLAGLGKVPQKIEPGDEWQGLIEENEEYQDKLTTGRLFVALGFSHTEKEVLIEIILSANTSPEADTQ